MTVHNFNKLNDISSINHCFVKRAIHAFVLQTNLMLKIEILIVKNSKWRTGKHIRFCSDKCLPALLLITFYNYIGFNMYFTFCTVGVRMLGREKATYMQASVLDFN